MAAWPPSLGLGPTLWQACHTPPPLTPPSGMALWDGPLRGPLTGPPYTGPLTETPLWEAPSERPLSGAYPLVTALFGKVFDTYRTML